jgi:Putative MetA-pathway of phenol degradation
MTPSAWMRVTRRTLESFRRAAAAVALLLMPVSASAQELEPGAYWPIPRGLNIITVINNFNWGDVAFDPAAPIDEASARINTTALAFTRAFSLRGRSANAGVVVPIIGGHIEGLYLGEPAEVRRFGQGDPRVRLAVNLYGAPAMTLKEFAAYQHRTIVGVSVTVVPPLGQYDSTKLINLGTHRWSFKPEVGFSRAYGKWVVEGMAGAWFFTDNTEFVGGRTRSQDPIVAMQVHVTHRFTRTIWLAADANYFTGGRTTLGGKQNLDLQRNSRVGATFSAALDRHQAIRMSVSRGAYTTIGADFTSVAVGYNYAWAR